MEVWLQFFIDYATSAHYLIFCFLLLAGCNVPISEDILIIVAASLAASVVPENTTLLFVSTFLGCYLSDWISYGIGRFFGRKLWNIPWFVKTVPKKRLEQAQYFYCKYGFLTLLFGRLIPFGVRNCLFLTAGIGKMPFFRFIASDGIACLFSNTLLFFLAYRCNRNIDWIMQSLQHFHIILFCAFIVTIISIIWYKRKRIINFTQHF
ncbi:MAG: DedA family protein [Chlamydiota bacterium]